MREILTTARLTIREQSIDDLDFMAPMLADPVVMTAWPRPLSREEAVEWIERQQMRYERDGCGYWLTIDRASREPVGQVGVIIHELGGQMEHTLGWMIHRPFQNRGYATEGARACIDWAWANTDTDRLVAPIRPSNEASVAVARKLGMHWEKCIPFHDLDHDIYVINR